MDETREALPKNNTIAPWYIRARETGEALSSAELVMLSSSPPLGLEASEIAVELEGPRQTYGKTVAISYSWRLQTREADSSRTRWRVEVPETCLWEPTRPYLYNGRWRQAGVETNFHLGWRLPSISGGKFFLNGEETWLQGLAAPLLSNEKDTGFDEEAARALRAAGYNLLYNLKAPLDMADRFGPMVISPLPANAADAEARMLTAGPRQPAIVAWELPIHGLDIAAARRLDPTSLFASRCLAQQINAQARVTTGREGDFLMLEGKINAVLAAGQQANRPWVALIHHWPSDARAQPSAWANVAVELDDCFRAAPACMGWIAAQQSGPTGS